MTQTTPLSPYLMLHLTLCTGQQFYFGSLAAIYQFLTPEQLGITLHEFYRHEENFKKTGKFSNHKCSLKRVEVLRAKHQKSNI
jgi:hypothetical protein